MTEVLVLVRNTLFKFNKVLSLPELVEYESEVSLQRWRDELGRTRIWAANIGAHQTGTMSLDYRLRDASHIKNQTVEILQSLQELLEDLEEVLGEDREQSSEETSHEPWKDELAQHHDLEDLSLNETETQNIHRNLVETITQLYQISMVIRQPGQLDRLMGMKRLDSEPFKFWARQHISHKYPRTEDFILDRLSSAMARQRAVLKYRERHREKFSQGLHEGGESIQLSETVATTLNHDEPPQSQPKYLDSNDGISQTSYAPSLMNGVETMRVPPMPSEGANHAPFECPYCFFIITVRDSPAWARHIFRDLQPYVCIFPDCPTPKKFV
jgi:hypothetical protein